MRKVRERNELQMIWSWELGKIGSGHNNPPLKILITGVQVASIILYAIAFALGCLSDVEDKFWLWRSNELLTQ